MVTITGYNMGEFIQHGVNLIIAHKDLERDNTGFLISII